MKRNNIYNLRHVGDTFFLVPSDDITKNEIQLIFLNETSVFLWELLKERRTIDDLTRAVVDNYDVDLDIAYRHVSEFISFLSDNKCLDSEERD